MTPKYIIIHHTATSRDNTTFEAINEYHRQKWNLKSSLGYYIGYHYLILGNGQYRQGRSDTDEGIHTKGWNDKAIGICLTGNFMEEKPSEAQLKTLKDLIETLSKRWNIPKENIKGHREVGATLCPGDNLMSWLLSYRSEPEIDRKKIIEEIKRLLDKLV